MDYYKVLGIKNTSTDKEIKNAYRMLAKKFHPDAYKGNKDIAESKMKELNEAYDVLSDGIKREEYDEKLNPRKSTYRDNSGEKYTGYSSTEKDTNDGVRMRPNQSDGEQNTAAYYYNYAPYEEEAYYGQHGHQSYNANFSGIKANIKSKLKHLLFVVIGLVVLTVVCISLIVRLLWKAVNGVIEYGNKAYISVQQNGKSEAESTTPPPKVEATIAPQDFTKEDIQKAIEQAEQRAQEWYNTEGKEYEEEWNKMVEELKLQIQEEIKKENNN